MATGPLEAEAWDRLLQGFYTQGVDLPEVAVDGRDHQGASFDFAYGINTNLLNHLLWTRSASSDVHRELALTWGDLQPFDVPVPPGSELADPAPLTGTLLTAVHEAFAEVGDNSVEFVLSRTVDPMLYWPQDPSQSDFIPGVGFPLYYGNSGLYLVIKYTDKNDSVGETILEADVSFFDEDFSLTFDETSHGLYLDAQLGTDDWLVSIRDSALLDCPMLSRELPMNQNAFGCEIRLEERLTLLLKEILNAIMQDLLDDIPAPQWYDAEGKSPQPVRLINQSREQGSRHSVHIFGQYNTVP